MFRSRTVVVLLLALVGAVAGCGNKTASKPTTISPITAKPPGPIVRQAATALRRVRSYRVSGTSTDENGSTDSVIDFSPSGAMRAKLHLDGTVHAILTREGLF